MKVTKETLENSQVALNIELEPAEMEHALAHAYREVVKKAAIPGFRKGKAPRSVVEKYFGKEVLLQEAVEHAVPEVYSKAVEEQKLDAIANPQIEITKTEPISFKATVPVRPTITLGDYRSIRVERKDIEISEDDVTKAIEEIRQGQSLWSPVERPAQMGDLVTLDVQGEVGGKKVDQKGLQLELREDSNFPAPGFAQQIVGLGKGEKKEFTLSVPSPSEEGKTEQGAYAVVLSEVKEKRLAELNDDFARNLGIGLETMTALRERVAGSLKSQAEEAERSRIQNTFIDEALKVSKIEYPPVMVEWELDDMMQEQSRVFQRGRAGMEAYLKNIGKTEKDMREDFKAKATSRVIRSLVVSKIAEEEKIKVEPSEVDAEIERMLQSNKEGAEQRREIYSQPSMRQAVEGALYNRRASERLVQIATGEATTQPETKPEEKPEETKEGGPK